MSTVLGIPNQYFCRFGGSTEGHGLGVGEPDWELGLGDSVTVGSGFVVVGSLPVNIVGLSLGSGESSALVGDGRADSAPKCVVSFLSPN